MEFGSLPTRGVCLLREKGKKQMFAKSIDRCWAGGRLDTEPIGKGGNAHGKNSGQRKKITSQILLKRESVFGGNAFLLL